MRAIDLKYKREMPITNGICIIGYNSIETENEKSFSNYILPKD